MNARILVVKGGDLHERLLSPRHGLYEATDRARWTPGGQSSPTGTPDLIVIQPAHTDSVAFQEILDRVNVALRTDGTVDHVVLGDITVDFERQRVITPGPPVHLTTQEFELLRYLAARRNAVVSRDELLREVWKYADRPWTRSVDNAIARLRKKIEPCPQTPMFIHTVHRDGYRLMPSGAVASAQAFAAT